MGWKPADLSRATGLDSSVISNIRNGKRGVGTVTATAIGKALHKKPELILKLAGELPLDPSIDEWTEEMDYKIKQIKTSGRRKMIEAMINSVLADEEAEQTAKAKRKPSSP